MAYSINEHLHRFGIWAAARAAQRSVQNFKIKNLYHVLEQIQIKKLINNYSTSDINDDTFKSFHIKVCNLIINNNYFLVSYGRAAKILSIYLKITVVSFDRGESDFSNIIHSPIDSILLKKLSRIASVKAWSKINWTELTQDQYWNLINEFVAKELPTNWRLEEYWDLKQQ